jgi:hypothetical protein
LRWKVDAQQSSRRLRAWGGTGTISPILTRSGARGTGLTEIPQPILYDRDAELRTLNVKHYPMYRKLKPAYRKLDNRSPRR